MAGRIRQGTARRALAERGAVLVTGRAGIGKTHFARSVVTGVDHVAGQALAPFSDETYRPLAHAFRDELWGSPSDVASAVVGRLGGRVLWIEDLHWADPGVRP